MRFKVSFVSFAKHEFENHPVKSDNKHRERLELHANFADGQVLSNRSQNASRRRSASARDGRRHAAENSGIEAVCLQGGLLCFRAQY
jgi:hypothetical protein